MLISLICDHSPFNLFETTGFALDFYYTKKSTFPCSFCFYKYISGYRRMGSSSVYPAARASFMAPGAFIHTSILE